MSVLAQLQGDVFGYLQSMPDLANVAGVLARPRDSDAEAALLRGQINQALMGSLARNGKVGLSYIVSMPTAPVQDQNAPGPRFHPQVTIRFVEILAVNMSASTGTQLACEDAALIAASGLHLLPIGRGRTLVVAPAGVVPIAEDENNKLAKVIYELNVETTLQVGKPGRAAQPLLSLDSGNATLTCGTDGAEIWFTTDSSFPGPSNGAATQYTTPFTVTSGDIIRAAAYGPDSLLGSSIFHQIIS